MRAVLNKEGIIIAKPGSQIEWGEPYRNFSSIGANQPILTKGYVAMQNYNAGGTAGMRDRYRRAVVDFTWLGTPPLAYCMLVSPDGTYRETSMPMQLSSQSGETRREPFLWWQTSNSQLIIWSRYGNDGNGFPQASYVICYNEAT